MQCVGTEGRSGIKRTLQYSAYCTTRYRTFSYDVANLPLTRSIHTVYAYFFAGALTRHVNSVHLRTGKTKECPICGYVTSSLLNLNGHLSSQHHLEIATAFARPTAAKASLSQSRSAPPAKPTSGGPPRSPVDDRLSRREETPLQPLHPSPPGAGGHHPHLSHGHHLPQPVNLSLASPLIQQYNKLHAAVSGGRPTALSPINSNVVAPASDPNGPQQPLFDCRFCEFKSTNRDEMVTHYNLEHLHLLYRELSQQRALEARKMAAAAAVNAAHESSVMTRASDSPPPRLRESPPSPPPPATTRPEQTDISHHQGLRLRKLHELKENEDRSREEDLTRVRKVLL